jgi:hypothetical protein
VKPVAVVLNCSSEVATDDKIVFDRAFFRKKGKQRWKGIDQEARKLQMRNASRKYWDSLTPGQRSEEMRRRAKVRAKNKKSQSDEVPARETK